MAYTGPASLSQCSGSTTHHLLCSAGMARHRRSQDHGYEGHAYDSAHYVAGEASMACQLVQAAKAPSPQLLQVFLEALCSHARLGLALEQLQGYDQADVVMQPAYEKLVQRLSIGK